MLILLFKFKLCKLLDKSAPISMPPNTDNVWRPLVPADVGATEAGAELGVEFETSANKGVRSCGFPDPDPGFA